jgi:hypothetical protein
VSGDRGGDVAQARGAPDSGAPTRYRGARGLDPRLIQELEKLYGFDQPAHVRFWKMLKSYAVFDFGQSFFRDRPVLALMIEKMPVSISLGLWSTLIIYLVSIPLGVAKAVRDGSPFDVWTSTAVIVGYAIPGFLFAILLIVVFAGGSYLAWFPLRGLVSANWNELSWPARILDYAWHMVLPVSRARHRRLRQPHHAHQELLPRGARQAVRGDGEGQGAGAPPRPLRARVQKRHADRHRGVPRGVHRHPVHRGAAHRGDLLARRPRPARLRGGGEPRLPHHVRPRSTSTRWSACS